MGLLHTSGRTQDCSALTSFCRACRQQSHRKARPRLLDRGTPFAYRCQPQQEYGSAATVLEGVLWLDFDRRIERNGMRSEEHTSELQSHLNIVCRLLLEKKKKIEI